MSPTAIESRSSNGSPLEVRFHSAGTSRLAADGPSLNGLDEADQLRWIGARTPRGALMLLMADGGLQETPAMTRRVLITLALIALTGAVAAGLLNAQGSAESARAPYRIDLLPGWNLISFPGDPVDTALESVLGKSQVDAVLAY